MELNGLPVTHGMEVEQDRGVVPDRVLYDRGGDFIGCWKRDNSGPYEVESIGQGKQVKSILKGFVEPLRGAGDPPWEWHNETSGGSGCGSHCHLGIDASSTEDEVAAYTIAWNSAVELTPFLAPFWCFDWESGFRSSVSRWASPQTTRLSQSSVESRLNSPSDRGFNSVTLNPPQTGGKPMTLELRLNENHPAFALVGLTFLRRTMTKCMREGWSPKLAGDRRRKLRELYSAVYNADGGLVEAMKSAGPFRFREGRGIPGSDQLEFESAWDVMLKVLAVNGIDKGAYDDRVKKLVQAAGRGEAVEVPCTGSGRPLAAVENAMAADGGTVTFSGSELGPQRNTEALWRTTDDDFSWDVGPEVA